MKKLTITKMGRKNENYIKILVVLLAVMPVVGCGDESNKVTDGNLKVTSKDTVQEGGIVEQAKQWPTKFCSLKIGMSRTETIKVMGKPTAQYSINEAANNGYQPQASWEAVDYNYTAFYDVNDNVKQLDDSSDQVPAQCAKSRKR